MLTKEGESNMGPLGESKFEILIHVKDMKIKMAYVDLATL